MRRIDLENRMVEFSAQVIRVVMKLPDNPPGRNLAGQMVRSATSSTLNYGEAQGGESRKDFIHKLKIAEKELRETYLCLRIISRAEIMGDRLNLQPLIKEANELICIFVKAVDTARRNMEIEDRTNKEQKSNK